MDAAAKASGLDVAEIKSYLPAGLTIWIDPCEVSCRLAENGPVQVIYRAAGCTDVARRAGTGCDGEVDGELQRVRWGGLDLTGRPIHDLSPSTAWTPPGANTPSPVVAGAGCNLRVLPPPPSTTPCFTAATFAQTKFGSTKMKSHGPQRPSRLSPTEAPLGGAAGFPSRLSPSSAPLSTCWGLSPTGGPSPTASRLQSLLQQHSPTAQFGVMPPGGAGDARAAGLHEWLMLQHHLQLQQQMQYLAAMKHQQQQRSMTSSSSSSGHHVTNARLQSASSAHLYDTQLHQQLQPQAMPPHPGLVTSPEVGGGLFAPDFDGTSRLGGAAWKNNAVQRLSPVDGMEWAGAGFDAGYANGLQQLLLAN